MFERDLPGHNTTGWGTDNKSISSLPLETCETINGSWGFNITDGTYKTMKQVVQLLAKDAGLGANLLLNIGPMPNGVVQPEFVKVLDSVGVWMQKNGESIYGTSATDAKLYDWGTTTCKGNTIYIHLLNGSTDAISLEQIPFKKIRQATLLQRGEKFAGAKLQKGVLTLSGLSAINHDPNDTVIKIDCQ
ncbi:MAG TPA: alpha-L-fucosidase, partial [Flavihumibacter sp.]|nr:alpha-L-fucosidase [Flavihumibacter sp.]